MKTTTHKLMGVMFVAAVTLGTGQPQGATKELRVRDIMASQPTETISASEPCRRARENPQHTIFQESEIAPDTLVSDLASLMQKSDEVILAGTTYRRTAVLSPSGKSVVVYSEVKVIRSWKGSHKVGDTLTFGVPAGVVHCRETASHELAQFSTMYGIFSKTYKAFVWKRSSYHGPYVLFLRHPQGEETQRVLGLMPAAGEGLQGMFPVTQIPETDDALNQCTGVRPGSVDWCASFLEDSQYPVEVPYVPDPLAKKYNGMPFSEFLREVRAVATEQGLDEKSQ